MLPCLTPGILVPDRIWTPLLGTPAYWGTNLPLWTLLPFGALLASIAIGPLAFPHYWEKNKSKFTFSGVLSLPIACFLLLRGASGTEALIHSLSEYACFFSLIGSLYVVAGGLALRLHWRPGPILNTGFLALAALSSNIVGTTGASILFFKPFLHLNQNRKHNTHLIIFYIITVGNVGGLLTPLGDPPLFLGYLNGIDFFWTLGLYPHWLVANGYLLLLFLVIDHILRKKEGPPTHPIQEAAEKTVFTGKRNLLFLLGIILTVLLQSPNFYPAVLAAKYLGMQLTLPPLAAALILAILAAFSYLFTPRVIHRTNDFTWEPVMEVGILFFGIFITMIPALEFLRAHNQSFPLQHAWEYFWLTGTLSSVLDNAPTFMAFCVIAAGNSDIATLPAQSPMILAAICCAAVFMGANTYIGNGPNFLIKAMAEKEGLKVPGFFSYSGLALAILLPLYLALTLLFFL